MPVPKRAAALLLCLCILAGGVTATAGRFSMSYIYFGSTTAYLPAVEAARGALDEVSPSYFDLNEDGSLKLTQALEPAFIAQMKTRGISVVPFLSNHWSRALGRTALANRVALASQIAAAVYEYGLDGINVDLENLTEADRDAYTDFVRLLREQMPDKTISVAVAANPYGWTTGWQGSYDYTALAAYSDYLMIMAYDEHYQNGSAGAVASYGFVEKSIRYALSKAPAEKLVLGLAFFGRIWNSSGGSPVGYGVSNTRAEALVRQYGGTVYFDLPTLTPCAVINIRASDEKPVIGGSALKAGSYSIWYENEESLKYKLELVNQYNLKGAGSWSLGQEAAGTWDYYSLWLSGCTFSDVQGHWASAAVLEGYLKGWITGITPSSYSPESSLTRAQAAVMLVRAMGLPTGAGGEDFADTQGHWAAAEIRAARDAGIIGGIGDNLFAPDTPVTREQMAIMLRTILPESGQSETSFTDVTRESCAGSFDAILTAQQSGVISGFPDGSFRPTASLTRAQMATMLQRAAVYIGGA